MDVTIKTPTSDVMQLPDYRSTLETLATNISIENLKFLAEVSKKPNVNVKLEKKKAMIKAFL